MTEWTAEKQLQGLTEEQQDVLRLFWLACQTMKADLYVETAAVVWGYIWGDAYEQSKRDNFDPTLSQLQEAMLRATKFILSGAGTVAFTIRIREGEEDPCGPPLHGVYHVAQMVVKEDSFDSIDPDEIEDEDIRRSLAETITASKIVNAAMNWNGDEELSLIRDHMQKWGPWSLISLTGDLMRTFLENDGDKLLTGE